MTPALEREFFSSLMTRNKTYKTTFPGRFADVNGEVLRYLNPGVGRSPRVLDLAVSSGVSTVELYDVLDRNALSARVVATDLFVDAYLVHVGPGCDALVDDSGFPLRFDTPFGSFKPWVTSRDYKTGLFLPRKGINTAFRYRVRSIMRDLGDPRVKPVKLVTPRLSAYKNIDICADDIRSYNNAFTCSFDFIRAANILNLSYFNLSTLVSIIENIRSYLRGPSAMLFVVRTHEDGSNHGTLFRLGHNCVFEVVRRFGTGSEVEELILNSIG